MAFEFYKGGGSGGGSSLPSQVGQSGKVLGTLSESLIWVPPVSLSGVFTTDSLFTWQSKTADFTAQDGYGYFINSVDNILIDFPSSPTIGDTFQVVLVANGAVGFNGKVNGVDPSSLGTDFYQGTTIKEKIFRFYYLDSAYGWFCDQPNDISTVYFGLVDPYLADVILFLKGDGANGSTSIIDSASSPNTITNSGAVISTTHSKYGGSSIYFNGSAIISCPDRADLLPPTASWCVEMWIRPTSLSGTPYLMGKGDAATALGSTIAAGLNIFALYQGSSGRNVSFTLTVDTWQHLAVVLHNSVFRAYLNGISVSSVAAAGTVNNTTQALQIGGYAGLQKMVGYLDSYRVTVNNPRYTSNFNPETDTYLA